jgi:cytochrome c peroxidase
MGARLFAESRFSYRRSSSLTGVENRDGFSCSSCHDVLTPRRVPVANSFRGVSDLPVGRCTVLWRNDDRSSTMRSSPSVVNTLWAGSYLRVFHYDGEFASAELLVKEGFLGRNFGWLPNERAEAIRHFARVIREDRGTSEAEVKQTRLPYAVLLCGTDPGIPEQLRLPEAFRCDTDTATDEQILDACSRLVVEFMRTLQFSRDASGQHDGSPYDAFLVANRLPRAPAPDQTPAEYGRRLAEHVATLWVPRFVDESARSLHRDRTKDFRFGELELKGLRIFFRSPTGNERSGAGNCAECHVPPHFSDFRFHNTGAAQDEYDSIHGVGAFSRLSVPDLATRDTDFERWLPANWRHPEAAGPFRDVPELGRPELTDLGVWNVYANPDLPAPQATLDRLLNPSGALPRGEVLDRSIARFKTSGLRDLGRSAPYLHTGQIASLEEVIVFYQRMSELARAGKMRNAPAEYFSVRLGSEDVAPLAAFLRALNED